MKTRLENFVNALAFKDSNKKVSFSDTEYTFSIDGDDYLTDLPVKDSVSIECPARDDTVEVEYVLLEAVRDSGVLNVTYRFYPDFDKE